jgi:hypothetical protein
LNEQRRKSDSGNKRLPPSERALNYTKALVTAWPVIIGLVGLLGYTNKDHIGKWVGLAQADGKTEITETGPAFESQVKQFSEEVRIEIVSLRNEVKSVNEKLAAQDRQNYQRLEALMNDIKQQVAEMQELVN